MNIQFANVKLWIACALAAGISACAESDLTDIHQQELDSAIAALDAPSPAAALPPDEIDLAQYNLVFSEEFTDDTLNVSKWNTSMSWGEDEVIYNQLQYYVDTMNSPNFGYDPFVLDGENLTISAIETPDNLRVAANEQPWLSGVLTTDNKFKMTFGYIETRVEFEQGLGIWPAFWMLSSELDALVPELYVMEYDGSKPDSAFHNYIFQDENGALRSNGQQEVTLNGLSSGAHTFGVRWTAEELLFYVDGEPSYRILGNNVPKQDMYLILNLAMGGIWTGAPDATTPRPASIKVDYIRAYQLKP